MAFNKKKAKSEISNSLEVKKSQLRTPSDNFRVSFEHLDTTQKFGSAFKDWQSIGLLSSTLDTLQGYCCSPLLQQVDGSKFTIYGDFPERTQTLFEHPAHVPPDANWARIHVNGPSVIIGHVVSNTFYLVFLDKTHKFWLTKRDREKYYNIK